MVDVRPSGRRRIRSATCAGSRQSRIVRRSQAFVRGVAVVEASASVQYETLPAGGGDMAAWALREGFDPEPAKPRLLDRVRQALRARHLSRRSTEEVTKFLTSLAVDGDVAASTQNQHRNTLRDSCRLSRPANTARRGAHARIERQGSQRRGCDADQDTLPELAGVAVLRRLAYPVAEF